MNNLQALMNEMSDQWRRERAESQMTLGKLIDRLEAMPETLMVYGFKEPHSYRGYYSHLSFEPTTEMLPASEAVRVCRSAIGEIFEGYKGGDYTMGRNTPVWIASYGCCGQKIIAVKDDGSLELRDDE